MATLRRSALVSVLFTLFGGPGIVLAALPFWITRFRIPAGEPAWQRAVAWLVIAAGLAPLLESIVRFVVVGRGTLVPSVPTERLVVSGLYRWVRNPMYAGNLLTLAGETLLSRSWSLALYTALVALGFDLFIRRYEEPTLTRRHPADYRRYRAQVPRWLPRRRPFRAE
ncbi:MAG: isoprenylcysteine carboxylmethyltransferase family protein [Terracidiphilus sp.]